MKYPTLALLVALIVLTHAAPAFAQRGGMGGRGGGGGRRGGDSQDNTPAVLPQPVNPVNLLIQHSRDLALADSQVKRIVAIKRSLDSTNTPYLRRLDSLQDVIRKSAGRSMDDDSPMNPRTLVQRTVIDIRTNILPARDQAYALLSPDQLQKAKAYEDDAERKYDDQVNRATRGGQRGG